LSDINSILKRVQQPLIKVSGYLVISLCVLIGLAVFFLFKKANREIDQRIKAEHALKSAHDDLEKRVDERTAELNKSVDELRKEISGTQTGGRGASWQ
jgi:C4-dicarboxylate-specific signal transduction histidine kinase